MLKLNFKPLLNFSLKLTTARLAPSVEIDTPVCLVRCRPVPDDTHHVYGVTFGVVVTTQATLKIRTD